MCGNGTYGGMVWDVRGECDEMKVLSLEMEIVTVIGKSR
jgi:hypothetical protein